MKRLTSILFISTLFFFQWTTYTSATSPRVKAVTTVSAFIGDNRFTLFGYTSPFATVNFEGLGIYDETIADENGYFIFDNRFSPLSSQEACLRARDTDGRTSQPLCLPAFPITKHVTIGPIIMPPTISVNLNQFYVNDNGVLQGQTIPNTNVNVSFFNDKKKDSFALPKLHISSDRNGYYSTSFPTGNSTTYRAFTTTSFENNPSGKSNTLTIIVMPVWLAIVKFFALIFSYILSHLLPFIVILEVIIIGILLLLRLLKTQKKHPLALRPDHMLDSEPTESRLAELN